MYCIFAITWKSRAIPLNDCSHTHDTPWQASGNEADMPLKERLNQCPPVLPATKTALKAEPMSSWQIHVDCQHDVWADRQESLHSPTRAPSHFGVCQLSPSRCGEQRHAAILGLGILCRFDFLTLLLLSGLNMCLPRKCSHLWVHF